MKRGGANGRDRARGTRLRRFTLLCGLLVASHAEAAELRLDDEFAIEVHGFVSQGFILSLRNDYLVQDSTDGSFEFAEAGINFTKSLTEDLRLGLQLFAQDLGPVGDYTARFDWFYLDYRFRDGLGLRAGRMKIPYGLYNEIQDIDAARVPILLPQSVYPLQTREILFAQTGGELYGFFRLDPLGAFEYRLFGGTTFLDPDELTPRGTEFDIDLRVPFVVGGRLIWETPLDHLRLGASFQALRLETTAFLPGMPSLAIDNDSQRWVAFAEWRADELTLTAEYSRWKAQQESSDPMLLPPIDSESERAYVMANYRVTPWFLPSAYYAVFFPDVDQRERRENQQHDIALTLRFDLNRHWLVKLEGHFMIGTAGLLNPLQINPPDISQAREQWGALFLKTTAHF